MSFHLKYRPKTFKEFYGNKSVKLSLKELIKKSNHPHCFLFYGNKGCGKTTLARILATKFNCSSEDIYEYNSANNRGVDTAREIINTISYKGINASNRMFILDEVHRTTKDFQNAMLKPTEDFPDNVYFVMCTTDVNKILKELRDRFMTFNIERLSDTSILKLLQEVKEKEKGKVDDIVLEKIAKKCESNREALVVLEKVIEIEDVSISKKLVEEFQNKAEAIELCRALCDSWRSTIKILNKLDKNEDPEGIRRLILAYFSKVILNPSARSSMLSRSSLILKVFRNNFFDSGRAGLIYACYSVFH